MGWVVLRERPNPRIWNDAAAHGGALHCGECQYHGGAGRSRTLRRARRHCAVRTAVLAVAPTTEGLSAARASKRVAHARPQGRRVHQGSSLENRSHNQGNGK